MSIVYRDRDPPPSYDGESPELTFRAFQKSVQLWEFETDIPAKKRGVKLLRALKGAAQLAVEDMEVDDITSELGVKNIMEKLKDYFHPHLEVSLPRAFETAVCGTPRQSKESFAEYVKRMERSFAHLAKEGVDLPDSARGYIHFRQASLSEPQEWRLLTWAEGKYTRAEITNALRRLDSTSWSKRKDRAPMWAKLRKLKPSTIRRRSQATKTRTMCTWRTATWTRSWTKARCRKLTPPTVKCDNRSRSNGWEGATSLGKARASLILLGKVVESPRCTSNSWSSEPGADGVSKSATGRKNAAILQPQTVAEPMCLHRHLPALARVSLCSWLSLQMPPLRGHRTFGWGSSWRTKRRAERQ